MEQMSVLLAQANSIKIPLADKSCHVVCTSPPYYGLRSYGIGIENGEIGLEPTPDDFVQAMVTVGRQLWRVLRDDGTWWLNLGDSYNGSGKGEVVSDKSLINYKANQLNHKTDIKNLKPKDLIGIPWMVAFALRNDGWILRQDIIWHKPNPMPESVKDRCTKAHEYIFLLTKSAKYYYDNEAVKEASKDPDDDRGARGNNKRTPTRLIAGIRDSGVYPMANRRSVWTISTKPYPGSHFATFPPDLVEPCILAGTSEKGVCPKCGAPWERVIKRGDLISTDGTADDYKPKKGTDDQKIKGRSDGWVPNHYVEQSTIGWRPTCDCGVEETVPATVFDPFVGSGTTLMVARKHGRNGIGLDLSFDYLNTNARERLVYGGFVPVADGVNQLTINM